MAELQTREGELNLRRAGIMQDRGRSNAQMQIATRLDQMRAGGATDFQVGQSEIGLNTMFSLINDPLNAHNILAGAVAAQGALNTANVAQNRAQTAIDTAKDRRDDRYASMDRHLQMQVYETQSGTLSRSLAENKADRERAIFAQTQKLADRPGDIFSVSRTMSGLSDINRIHDLIDVGIRRDDANANTLAAMGIGGEQAGYRAIIAGVDPAAVAAIGIRTASTVRTQQLINQGKLGLAAESAESGRLGLEAIKAEYLRSFKFRQVNLALEDVTNPNEHANPAETLKLISTQMDELKAIIQSLGGDN